MVKTKNLSGYSKKILRTSGGREEVQLLPGPVSHLSIGYCYLVPYFSESCFYRPKINSSLQRNDK